MLCGPLYPPFQIFAVVHNVHRAQLRHVSSVRCHLTLFILSWYAGRSCDGDDDVHRGAPNNYFCSFSVGRTDCICLVELFAHASLVARLTTTSAAFPLAEQIVYAWDFGCITSHAQSTVATYNTGAVSPDVVHLIVLCWAPVFRGFRDWSH